MGIIVAIIATLIFGGLFMFYTQRELHSETKTVGAFQAKKFIPMGTPITDKEVEKIEVPVKIAKNLVTDSKYFDGKITTQNIGKEQYIFTNSLATGLVIRPGYGEVYIPTDLSKSAMAIPGELVDLYPIDRSSEGIELPPIFEQARVIHSLDQEGNDIDPGRGEALKNMAAKGDKIPVAIGIELPKDKISKVVLYAYNKNIYLVKSPQQ